MKLEPYERELKFNQARQIDPRLGDLFQNEQEITSQMISVELGAVKDVELSRQRWLARYRTALLEIQQKIQERL